MKKYTEEELKQIFENRSNCYADCEDVVMAMDKDRFIEVMRELKILPNNYKIHEAVDMVKEKYPNLFGNIDPVKSIIENRS